MRPTVVLFDVDGTLITTGGAGRRALERAFETAFGEPGVFDFSFGGMTDYAIIRGGLTASGRDATAESIRAVLDVYLDALTHEVRAADVYRVHVGIHEALDALERLPNVAVGLGTGNIERGARIKLDRARINHRFEFGGFGCDAEDRAELIGVGAARGAARLGCDRNDCRLVIVGDTPKDVRAAHDNGGECIAVATGGCTADELRDAGARWVVDDLSCLNVSDLFAS